METREVIIEKFLKIAMDYSGRAPEFKLTNEGVTLLDAPGGFLKKLIDTEGANVSLTREGIIVSFFKR